MHATVTRLLGDVRGSWRYRKLALITMWALAAAGWLWIMLLPNVYEASAKVYVDTQGALRPLLRGLAVETNIESELAMVRQAMLSGPQLESIAREAGISTVGKTAMQREASMLAFQSRIKVTKDTGSTTTDGLYRISYESDDRQQTLYVVKKLLDSFVEGTLGSKRVNQDDAQQFLEKQISEYEQRLSADEEKLANFKKANVGKMPTDNNDYYARLQLEMRGLTDTQSNLALAQARQDEISRQLTGEEPYIFGFDSENAPSAASGGAGGDVAGRIQELEKRREELLLRFTPKHPEVLAVDRTLADLKVRQDAELSRVRGGQKATGDLSSSLKVNPVYQRVQMDAKQVAVQVAELRRDLGLREARVADLRRLVSSVPDVEAELVRLNRTYEATRTKYQELVGRLETAKLSDEAEKTGTIKFQVIEPPTVPETPVSPKRPLLLTGVMLAALAGGAALAYLLNLLQPVFYGWQALSAAIGAPVIGCVHRFEATSELADERRGQARVAVIFGGLVVLYFLLLVWSASGARLIERLM